jgi:hypothetical protein
MALVLLSLFAVASSATSVSGKEGGTMRSTCYEAGRRNNLRPLRPCRGRLVWHWAMVFAVDSTGALQYTLYGNSSTWNSLGRVCTASPAAVSWGSTSRFDVFVRGGDGAAWWTYSNDGGSTWSSWTGLHGQLAPNTGPP